MMKFAQQEPLQHFFRIGHKLFHVLSIARMHERSQTSWGVTNFSALQGKFLMMILLIPSVTSQLMQEINRLHMLPYMRMLVLVSLVDITDVIACSSKIRARLPVRYYSITLAPDATKVSFRKKLFLKKKFVFSFVFRKKATKF